MASLKQRITEEYARLSWVFPTFLFGIEDYVDGKHKAVRKPGKVIGAYREGDFSKYVMLVPDGIFEYYSWQCRVELRDSETGAFVRWEPFNAPVENSRVEVRDYEQYRHYVETFFQRLDDDANRRV